MAAAAGPEAKTLARKVALENRLQDHPQRRLHDPVTHRHHLSLCIAHQNVDGANVWRTFWSVIVPLTRPALAALATLEFTFIYNDYFWALVLVQTGSKRPITSALSNLQGMFFTDNNLIAAGAVLVALPTIITYLALQRHFVRGLTLGATKG